MPVGGLRLPVENVDRELDRLGRQERRVGAEDAGGAGGLHAGRRRNIVGEGGHRHDLAAGILQRLDGAGTVSLRQDAIDFGMGSEEASHAFLFRTKGVLAVVIPNDLDARIFGENVEIALLELGRYRRAGKAAVDEDLPLAVELLRHPFGEDRRNAVPVGLECIGAGLRHHLVEADDDDPGVAGLLERRVQGVGGSCINQDCIRLVTDDVVERVDLRLDRILDIFNRQVDASGERPLLRGNVGDALHLLAPVVSDEIIGEIDRVFLSLGSGPVDHADQKRCRNCGTRQDSGALFHFFLPF